MTVARSLGWLAKLRKYNRKHGDCDVPRGWAEDTPLSRWVSSENAKRSWTVQLGSNRPLLYWSLGHF
jgi:hypothetical protein